MITIQRKLGKCSASQHLKLELLNPHFFGAQRLRSSCVLLGPRSLKVSGTWTGGLKWVPFGHDGQRTSGAPVGTWIECACLVLNQSESSNFRGQTGSAYIIAEECPTGRKMDSSPLEEHHTTCDYCGNLQERWLVRVVRGLPWFIWCVDCRPESGSAYLKDLNIPKWSLMQMFFMKIQMWKSWKFLVCGMIFGHEFKGGLAEPPAANAGCHHDQVEGRKDIGGVKIPSVWESTRTRPCFRCCWAAGETLVFRSLAPCFPGGRTRSCWQQSKLDEGRFRCWGHQLQVIHLLSFT